MKRLRRWWEANTIIADRLAALLASGVAIVWIHAFGGAEGIDRLLGNSRRDVYGVLASIAGSLLGFAIAALSIILTLPATPRVELLRGSRHYGTLCGLFMSSTRWLALATASSFLGMILDGENSPGRIVMSLTVVSTFVSFARIARLIWAMKYLVEIATK